ncbi:hypothetical protein PCANC_12519 [Puccinia coronata f. sp. avenae]|uniref:Uncharacterized protein n=1 Tax=Puccinia coronata f. sp. avenae TaxID=200324 RepID=A0A2N5SSI5_9BASI|nr:hypothetical protein PCANC_12519 [Puccinia coronata f. sp. avenae]
MITLTIEQKALLAFVHILLLIEIHEEDNLPYYSDGGQATLVTFLLNEARPDLFREVTSLERTTFDSLVTELTSKGLLEDGRSVTCEEQVLIFLDITVHNNSMRHTAMKFRRGLFTIQRYFHQVLHAFVALYPKYVQLKENIDCERLQDPKYFAFKKCLGALDGVLIPMTLPMHKQAAYRSRKSIISQNVLAVVNFDLEFLYVLAGWEGSAHDSRVLADAFNKGFSVPNRKFYLADAGYALQKGLITPFRATRYHLKEQAAAGLQPETPKELFNLRHASLRNVVERIFGCLKAKFKILTTPSEHCVHSQVQLVFDNSDQRWLPPCSPELNCFEQELSEDYSSHVFAPPVEMLLKDN